MYRLTKKVLILMTSLMVALMLTQVGFAAEDDSNESEESEDSSTRQAEASNYSATVFSVDKIKKNNSAFHFELSFTEIPIKPDIFYDETLNGDLLKIQGASLGLGKGFSLGGLLFIDFNLRGAQASKKATVSSKALPRNSVLLSYQAVVHIGFNIRSIMIDHASMHPFVGVGYQRSTFTDTYTNTDGSTDYNKIMESGSLAEFGINFIDQYTGMFSSFKVGKFMSSSKTYESSIETVVTGAPDLSINEAGSISTSNSTYYSVGFGLKF
jgi:hypothetical protein